MAKQLKAEKDSVRVTVQVRDATVDMSLPNRVQNATLAPEAARIAVERLRELDMDTSWLENPTSEILFSPDVGGRTWSATSTLDECGVKDGDFIILSVSDASERYREIVEVMQDATARTRNARFREWDSSTSYVFASYAFPALISTIALVAGASAFHMDDNLLRWGVVLVTGLIGALTLGLSFGADKWETRDERIGQSLAVSSYVPIAVAVATMIPGDISRWNIMAAAVATTVTAVVFIMANRAPMPAHYAALIPSLATVLGIAAAMAIGLWRNVEAAPTAAIIATMAVLVFHNEPGLSRMGARLELPYLPAQTPTDDDEMNSTIDVAELSRTLSQDSSWESMLNERERNIAARNNGLGIVMGTLIALVGSSIVAAAMIGEGSVQYLFPQVDQRGVMLFHFGIIAAIFVLRGSWYRDRALRSTSMIGGATAWIAYILSLSLISSTAVPAQIAVALAVFLLVVLIGTAMAWRGKAIRSARARSWLERAESLLFLFPFVNIAVLVNVFFMIRHR